jgi:pimeloyl-ACP methyl ester carboxylesterase
MLRARSLVCVGEKDPWIRPAAADLIQQLHPAATRVSIDAGHCPHDEAPEAVNEALISWLDTIGFGGGGDGGAAAKA